MTGSSSSSGIVTGPSNSGGGGGGGGALDPWATTAIALLGAARLRKKLR